MRRLLLLAVLAVTVAGCGQAAAPATPTAAPQLTPRDILAAFGESGLLVYPTDRSVYNAVQGPGLVAYETFTDSRIGGGKHVVALYDTAQNAEAARAGSTTRFTTATRRGTLVLVWGESAIPHEYFTLFQVAGR